MKEITEISERISIMIESLGSNPNSFAKSLGYPRAQTIYDIVNGKSAPSYDFFRRFQLSEYSDIIEINWLLTGRGVMLNKSNESNKNANLNANLNANPLHEKQNLSDKNTYLSPRLGNAHSHPSIAVEPDGESLPIQQYSGANDIIMSLVEQLKEQSEEIGALRQENSSLKHRLAQLAQDAEDVNSVPA